MKLDEDVYIPDLSTQGQI